MKSKYTSAAISCAAAVALFTSGCASIVHGGNRSISINSAPEGAKVTICKANSPAVVVEGKTPYSASLDPKGGYFKGQDYTVTIEMQGYKTAHIDIHHEMSGWFWGNIVFGGLIGILAVDPVTGSMWNLTPEKISQPLTTEQAAIVKEQNGVLVMLVQDLSAEEQQALVRIN